MLLNFVRGVGSAFRRTFSPAKAGHHVLPKGRHYVLIAIATSLLLAGCGKQEEEEEGPVVTIDVAPVLSSQIQRIVRAQALVYPKQQAAIVPKITAPIKKFYVEKGATVRAGQLLVELENADLAGAARESEAAYEAAEATYQTTAHATVPEEAQKAELDVQSAKTALDAAQAVYENRQRLFQEGAIAQKDVNDARVNFTQAKNQYEIAQKRLNDLRGFGNEQALKAATAQRDQARARRDAAVAQLSYSRITSPIDGVVTDRPLYAGETPQSGSPIITVMDLSQVIARAHIAPTEASELKVGNDASLIGADNTPVAGKVTQISPALDPSNTTLEVWVQTDNPGDHLKPGTSVRVELIAKTVPNALVIPQAALLTSGSGATSVIVIDPENKPHKKSVTTGIRDAGAVQITEGLDSGQRVATTGGFELGKLEPDVLEKTKVQIQTPKEEEEEPDTP
jgi:multidrug efflux pump subunit AcrA (membrane-fusion protein)